MSGRGRPPQSSTVHALENDEFFVGSVTIASNSDDWTATLNVNGVSVPFNLDTGSQCNVISKETHSKLCTDQVLDKSTSRLITYSGHKMIPCGQKDLVCEYRDKSYMQRFQVVDQSAPSILGRESCLQYHLVQRVMMVDDSMNCEKIVSQYDTLFKGLGCLPGYHHINIKQGTNVAHNIMGRLQIICNFHV